jgi:hypothetical protein
MYSANLMVKVKRLATSRAGEDVEQTEFSNNVKKHNHFEKQFGNFLKC